MDHFIYLTLLVTSWLAEEVNAASHLRAPTTTTTTKPVPDDIDIAAPHRLTAVLQGKESDPTADLPNHTCGCTECTAEIWGTMAGDLTCLARISWLELNRGMSGLEACRQVAAVEHPDECGACNPDICTGSTKEDSAADLCGSTVAATCTSEVLSTQACDDNLGGCHSCGDRIQHLIDSEGHSNIEACKAVAVWQFASECGSCSPGPLEMEPTPTLAPTEDSPIPIPATATATATATSAPSTSTSTSTAPSLTYDNRNQDHTICTSESCTPEIWETMTCDDTLGGCFSCGSRINYLVEEMDYDAHNACEMIAFAQFPALCGGCMPGHLQVTYPPVDRANLVWSDEFDQDGAPDPTKWSYDVGSGDWGWGNNELQYYTDRLDNSFIENGQLTIRAKQESMHGMEFTSARLVSKFQGDWTYGRIQVRAKLPGGTARGTWAAIWMLSTDDLYNGWPDSGEIDIMEHVGYDTGRIHGTVHTEAFNHMKGTQDGGDILMNPDDWYIHEIRWTSEKIEFVLDDFAFHTFYRREGATYREWPFDERFHLILNMAVGGMWGGALGVDEAAFAGVGQTMEIDWIRVYSQ